MLNIRSRQNRGSSLSFRQAVIPAIMQLLCIGAACLLALMVSDLGQAAVREAASWFAFAAVLAIFSVCQLGIAGVHWLLEPISPAGMARFILSVAIACLAVVIVSYLRILSLDVPLGLSLVLGSFSIALTLVLKIFITWAYRRNPRANHNSQRAIVVGTGKAAASLIQVLDENPDFLFDVVGCVDEQKLADRVVGRPVLGKIDDLPQLIAAQAIGSVIVAIPSAPAPLVKRTINACMQAKGANGKAPAVKIMPGVLELLNDGVKISRIRSVDPEDLLPRDPVKVDLATIAPHVENRIILVTGAGGSIGSELCRQIAALNPRSLWLLGHGENSLFAIDEELKLKHGFTRTRIILADVADAARIRNVFSECRPHIVFHAAAHKHVPIVESNVCEAVRNNILGTHVVALAAAAAGAAKFVLLSTDKAVNPTSVMGVTKRLSEIISQSFVNQTGTEFVTVRFGNVLESRGSVIPVFKKQIENGGPVTITHRDMQRYFMTIPEAVSLVLQAMAIGRDGQVLVLDMGKPVNILNLAKTLITLSGLTPYRDIGIVETGIRPGEKLFEEILTLSEGLSTTSHARLFIAQQERVAYETLALGLRALETGIQLGDRKLIIDVLRNFVPSFQPGSHLVDGKMNGEVTVTESQLEPAVSSANGHAAGHGNGQPGELVEADAPTAWPAHEHETARVIGP